MIYSSASPALDLFNQTTGGKGEILATGIRNVDIEELSSTLPFTLDAGGPVDHVIVRNHGGGTALSPLGLTSGTQLIGNSLFVSRGFGSEGVGMSANGTPQTVSVTLRNDTLYATGVNARALSMSIGGFTADVFATNVIADGEESDVSANEFSGGQVNLSLDHSNYARVFQGAGTTVSAAGSGSNQTAPPLFVSAGEDFHQQASSPTLDAGAIAAENGPTDLDGNPRTIGPSTDIGAYEAVEGSPLEGAASATAITMTGATLGAAVNPDFAPTKVQAFLGTSSAAEMPLGTQELAAASTGVPVAFAATSLTPGVLYHFHLTATNRLGTASTPDQSFATLMSPVVPVPAPGAVTVLSSSARLHGSAVPLKLSCSVASAGCRGVLLLRVRVRVKVRIRGHHPRLHTVTVTRTLGRASFAIAAGQSTTVSVPVTREARTRLGRARHRRLAVTATANRTDGGVAASRSIVLFAPATHRRAKR